MDTTKPLEAVHKGTGRIVPMTYDGPMCEDRGFNTKEAPCDATSNVSWRDDGTDYCWHDNWIIQNVTEAPKPRQAAKLTPLATQVLNYLQAKGDASPLEATLDLGINSGSFTRRITELRRAGYPITDAIKFHPTTGRQYKRYYYKLDS